MADKWNVKGLAVASGIFYGVYLAAAAGFASANITTVWFSPQMFSMLASIYPGLTATTTGIFVGLLWGLFCGALCGGIFAWLYNWASAKCK